MRKVIAGKRYDTETSTEIATSESGDPCNNGATTKTLYRTPLGAWWFCKSRKHDHGHWVTDIEPVAADDAYAYLESHSDQEAHCAAIESYFADRIVDA